MTDPVPVSSDAPAAMPLASRRRPSSSRLRLAAGAVIVALGIGLLATPLLPSSQAAEGGVRIAAPADDPAPVPPAAVARAILAGGCFWGVQGVFQHVEGVSRVVSGYSGGTPDSATYDRVSTGRTGHAESVEITYDPARISYGRLLQIFFSVAHDPTQLDRQGPDHGTQYRSAIFATTPDQARIARAYIAQLDRERSFPAPIVTTVADEPSFFAAEDVHQDFMMANPTHPYIVVHDLPKLEELRRLFADRYRAEPVLVKAQVAG